MLNTNQCQGNLLYDGFTVVFIQTFSTSKIGSLDNHAFINRITNSTIDDQLFTHDTSIMKRYKLPDFNIKIEIEEPYPFELEGKVKVCAARFFDNTIQISYRIVIPSAGMLDMDEFCSVNIPCLNTDQLIAIASITQGAEHWSYNRKTERQEIEGVVKKITISGLPEDKIVDSFYEAQKIYAALFCPDSKDPITQFHQYAMVDIWENIGHDEDLKFKDLSEEDIVSHIETTHKPELMGLMSFYPREWSYRCDEFYTDICGDNIAIDTDDLVLANNNICVVFGTYGRRGGDQAPTDWSEHLKQRKAYHVSWPEYLVLLEIALAKKQIINWVYECYSDNAKKDMCIEKVHDIIEDNAFLSLKLTNIMIQLDSMRYLRFVSHQHMFKKAQKRLGIDEDIEQLSYAIERIDASLINVNGMTEVRASNETKNILWFISVASLFGVVMQNDSVPVISKFSDEYGFMAGLALVAITSIGILLGLVALMKMTLTFLRRRKKRIEYGRTFNR